ncbi:MAG: DUF934 domain-containing protein [Gammaproteobacteria bacterium]|nr:DUF934 domain-containing protein [Gammaproteobacteria bacterium]
MPSPVNSHKTPAGPQPQNPAELIVDGAVVANDWHLLQLLGEDEPLPTVAALPAGKLILPVSLWLLLRQELLSRQQEIGVWLDSDESAELIGDHGAELPLIAIHFCSFADGRGFTSASILRQRYGYQGELRATGRFMQDQLTYLRRCGFNAFAFEGGAPLDSLLDSLQDFSESYQAASDQPLPVFRRRPLC